MKRSLTLLLLLGLTGLVQAAPTLRDPAFIFDVFQGTGGLTTQSMNNITGNHLIINYRGFSTNK